MKEQNRTMLGWSKKSGSGRQESLAHIGTESTLTSSALLPAYRSYIVAWNAMSCKNCGCPLDRLFPVTLSCVIWGAGMVTFGSVLFFSCFFSWFVFISFRSMSGDPLFYCKRLAPPRRAGCPGASARFSFVFPLVDVGVFMIVMEMATPGRNWMTDGRWMDAGFFDFHDMDGDVYSWAKGLDIMLSFLITR